MQRYSGASVWSGLAHARLGPHLCSGLALRLQSHDLLLHALEGSHGVVDVQALHHLVDLLCAVGALCPGFEGVLLVLGLLQLAL